MWQECGKRAAWTAVLFSIVFPIFWFFPRFTIFDSNASAKSKLKETPSHDFNCHEDGASPQSLPVVSYDRCSAA